VFEPVRAATLGVGWRPMRDEEEPFVAAVYASTRTGELEQTGWPDEFKQAFLTQQHQAQHHHYRTHYEGADWLIVERDGQPIGRLYLFETAAEIRLIDIAFLTAHRGGGIGRALIDDLLGYAAAYGKKISLHVEHHNPVRRLYLARGFVPGEDVGAYQAMMWTP
jgi:GNAT superfamily N-acetyltransferase